MAIESEAGVVVPATVPFPSAMEAYPRVRQSLLSTFDSCGLAAKLDMDLRSHWSSHPAARGSVLHRVFAKCINEIHEYGEAGGPVRIPVDLALAVLDEAIRQHDVPMDSPGFGDHVVPLSLKEIAEARIIAKTWAAYSEFNPAEIAGVEKRLDTVVQYPDGHGGHVDRVLTGAIDLLLIPPGDVVATVVDYKTGWAIPSERRRDLGEEDAPPGDNISEEGYFQQRFYALLIFKTRPRVKRVVLREVYPRYLSGKAKDRKGRPINPVRQATIDREVLPELEAEMSALVERFDRAYEAQVWRPAPGSHCSYCPRPEACTIWPSARVEGRLGSLDEAETLAGRLNVLNAMRDQATKALRQWAGLHGAVPIRDAKRPRVYGPLTRTRKGKDGQPEEYQWIGVHSPEEVHPSAAAAAAEERALAEMERAAAARKAAKR